MQVSSIFLVTDLKGRKQGKMVDYFFWHELIWVKQRKYFSSLFKHTGENQNILATIRAYLSTKVKISYHGSKKWCL